MKRTLKWLAVFTFLLCALSISASAATNQGTHLLGSNEGFQNYSTYGSPVYSYLTTKSGRLMTVTQNTNGIEVAYYNTDYTLYKTKAIKTELPIFGGFYETENNYYILSGQTNLSESNSVEVYRITKYDKLWQRLGSVGLYGVNTTYPFDAGSARFAHKGNVLVVRTCHEMYTSEDGLNHQANVTFSVNTDTMSVITSHHIVANVTWGGYVSHSFNQFIRYDGNQLVAVDHGDAYPRSVCLVKYGANAYFTNNNSVSSVTTMYGIPGSIGDNFTGVSVGGLEASPSTYIVVGNAVWSGGSSTGPRNIFVSTTPRSGGNATVTYLTSYTDASASTPHIVKMSNDYYLVMWTKGEYVYYVRLNASGQKVGSIYKMKGKLSDCAPVVINKKVQWYTYNGNDVTFYSISTASIGSTAKKTVNNGHKIVQKSNSSYHWDGCVSCSRVFNKKVHKNTPSTTYVGFDTKGNWVRACATCDYVYKSNPVTMELKVSKDSYGNETLTPVLKIPTRTLKEGIDYRYYLASSSYTYNSGHREYYKATVCVYGTNYHSEQIEKEFTSLTLYGNIADIKTQTYTGRPVKPAVKVTVNGKTLKNGTDYTVSYKNNTKVGTATVTVTGKGRYFGTAKKTFYVGRSVSSAKVTGLKTKTYTGNNLTQTPKVVVKDKVLKKGVDYTISYKNNRKAGTAKITIKGIGKYTGSITKTFKIQPANISKCKVTLSSKTVTYNGKVQAPSVVVKSPNGTTLKRGVHYTVKYEGKRITVGTYKVTVKMLKGNFTGSKTLTFKITPPKTAVTSLTGGKSKIKLVLQKQSKQVSGYEIQYGTTKSVNAKIKTITSYKTAKTTLWNLKSEKTYYVRVRTYKTVNGKKVYSAWSAYKSVKTT